MARMRVYTVHINPSLPYPYEAAEFVPEAFNGKAFLFAGLWALYNRLWLAAFLMIIYSIVMAGLLYSEAMSHVQASLLDLAGHLIIGFHANDWLRSGLKKRGYLTADLTSGDSELRAEQRYFDRYVVAAGTAA